jgi:hypothetical protein
LEEDLIFRMALGVKDVSMHRVKNIAFARIASSIVAQASILRAAWSIVLSRYCDSDDIVFGTAISGRNAPVVGIETVVGPAIAIVPVRVRLSQNQTVSSFLSDIQSQANDMIPYEQIGLQNIAKLGPYAKEACDFQSLLVIQPAYIMNTHQTTLYVSNRGESRKADVEGYFLYPIVIQCELSEDNSLNVQLHIKYNSSTHSPTLIEALGRHFKSVLDQLVALDRGI